MTNEVNNKYSWDPEKRSENVRKRGLDFVPLADDVFSDPDVVIEPDIRRDYGEDRFNAYGIANGMR